MDYGAILTRAWGITWKYRALWVLGIVATLIGAGDFSIGRSSGSSGGGSGGENGTNGMGTLPPETIRFLESYGLWIILGVVAFIFVLALVFSVGGWWLKGGLIHGIDAADRNGAVSLRELGASNGD